jgi:steroid delta-isomerase-like uncharacterized protein
MMTHKPTQKQQVRLFYQGIWDRHDKSLLNQVLHPDLTFRGSLGDVKQGHDGFSEYLDRVHAALGDYHCRIDDLVEEDDRVFARMTFSGIHRAEFLGYPATGKRVSWSGCALFSFEGELVRDIWVLGDLKSLEMQLVGSE